MASDATNKQPTLEEQIGSFKGFAVQDGELQAPATSTKAIAAAQEGDKSSTKAPTPAERLAALDKPAKAAKSEAAEPDDNDEPDAGGDAPAEDADEDEGEEQPERQPKAKSADKRIAQAVGRQRAAERERDAERARTAALEARLARLEAGLTPPQARGNNTASDAPPDPSDYQYGELDTKFIADTARYETLKTLAEQETRRAAQAQQQRQADGQAAMAEKFREFEAEGLARYPDFDEVVSDSAKRGEWALSPLLASLLIDSEHGTDIAYHLATNRNEAKRVFGLTPAQQAKWFGQREAVLSSETPDARHVAARVSQAPGVPRREARGSGSRQQVSPDTADFAAFERLANTR